MSPVAWGGGSRPKAIRMSAFRVEAGHPNATHMSAIRGSKPVRFGLYEASSARNADMRMAEAGHPNAGWPSAREAAPGAISAEIHS